MTACLYLQLFIDEREASPRMAACDVDERGAPRPRPLTDFAVPRAGVAAVKGFWSARGDEVVACSIERPYVRQGDFVRVAGYEPLVPA